MIAAPVIKPRHVAVAMDSNGRWATQCGLPRSAGHKAGADKVIELARAAVDVWSARMARRETEKRSTAQREQRGHSLREVRCAQR